MWTYVEAQKRMVLGYSTTNPATNASALIYKEAGAYMAALELDTSLKVDTILPHTTNGGVTVGGVTATNGALTGVASVNGVAPTTLQTISIVDNATTAVTIPGTTATGAYIIYYLEHIHS